MRLRTTLLTTLTATMLLATGGAAEANLTKNGKFVFRGHISVGDPVNILWHGGAEEVGGSCFGDGKRSANCILQHLKEGWGDMAERGCSGAAANKKLEFLTENGGTASPGAVWDTTTSNLCKRQYHYRNWSDGPHGHGTDHQFGVGAVHHEDRGLGERGHDIKYHWETAEHVMVTQMGRGDKAHCTYRNYRRLPGSGNAKGKKSNGKISRISFHHIEDGGCSGE